ncbi:DUF1753-domain-containing protein [Thozetella sp. PMI_491]|nr:DUF1753-domain-containing protein [Thozetella sp. PMI_491]
MAPSRSSYLRLPRPKTFLGLLSLQTGAELVSLALLINKAIGFYGVLAILTGYSLSALQLSMYIYSLLLAVTLAYLIRHIRKQSPLQNLALAWLYVLDTIINTAYTTAFAIIWYLEKIHNSNGAVGSESSTDANGAPEGSTARRGDGYAAQSGAPDTPMSIVLIVAFTLVRVYFSLVIMAYARSVLQRFIGFSDADGEEASKQPSLSPFAVASPLGQGLAGKLGRAMISVGRGYWLGQTKEDEEWARSINVRFSRSRRKSSKSTAPPATTIPSTEAGPSSQ